MKNLLFVKTQVEFRDRKNPEIAHPVSTWELLPIGNTPILHAMWNPESQTLVINYNSSKDTAIPENQVVKNKLEQIIRWRPKYYNVSVSDRDAIIHLLKTQVDNFTDDTEWEISWNGPEVNENKEELIES